MPPAYSSPGKIVGATLMGADCLLHAMPPADSIPDGPVVASLMGAVVNLCTLPDAKKVPPEWQIWYTSLTS
jgi:hypothetical protein